MLISRKRFEEELAKARNEVAEEIYQRNRMDEMERDFFKRCGRIEDRLSKVEQAVFTDTNNNLESTAEMVAVPCRF